MKGIAPVHPKYLIISAELLADLGNLLVGLTLLDVLILHGERALSNLVVLCVVQQLPAILLSPLAGVWMGRVGVKKWLTAVNVSKCSLLGLFAFRSSVWVIFPAYLCFTAGSLFFHIGRLSLTPVLIPKDELISFNALNERVSLGGSIFGPWVIGWIILKTGQGVALGLAGVLLVLSVCAICRLPKLVRVSEESKHHATRGSGLRPLFLDYTESFRTGYNLKTYFFVFAFVLLGGGVLNIGLPILYKTNFGKSIADWGLILSGFQAGSCAATFLLPRWSSTFRHGTMLSFTFLFLAGAMAILGHLTSYIQIALLMILFGCGFTLMHIFLESLIQQNSSRAHIGKTMSLLTAYRGACYLGAILASALVLHIWGLQILLLAASLLMISASLVTRRTSG